MVNVIYQLEAFQAKVGNRDPKKPAGRAALHDDVEVGAGGEGVVEADDKGVVCQGEDVALVAHGLHHVLADQVRLAHHLLSVSGFSLQVCARPLRLIYNVIDGAARHAYPSKARLLLNGLRFT